MSYTNGKSNDELDGIFGGLSTQKFDNPFFLPSSSYYPNSLSSAFDFCRFLYFTVPIYRQVALRTARYFITEFEYLGKGSSSEKENLDLYLKDVLKLKGVMMQMGDEWGCYGNAFTTFYYPFNRMLVDTRSGKNKYYNLNLFDSIKDKVEFNSKDMTYIVPDPANGFKTKIALNFVDVKVKDKNKIRLRPIDPRYIRIQFNEISGKSRYILKFNNRIRSNVMNNYLYSIDDTPRSMLEAIKENKDFAFYDNEVFHFRSPVISGLSYQNWGLPEPIANFRQIYQILIYQKLDETVALDYMLPFRIFSAEPSSQGGDIMQNLDMSVWSSEIKKIIDSRRKDKFAMHAFPFPVNYQEFGGNGKMLTPKDLLEFQINNLFNCCGFPQELFTGSLNVNQVPTALRLFQNNFWFLYENYNTFTKWVVKKIQEYTDEQPIDIQLQLPKLADNIELTNVKLQLGMQGDLPRDSYLKALGISNGVDAVIKRREEDMEIELQTQKKQEELERRAQAEALLEAENSSNEDLANSQSAPGVQDMEARAQAKAQEWLSIPSTGERTKAMQATKAESFELYSLAKQIMDEMRDSARRDAARQAGI